MTTAVSDRLVDKLRVLTFDRTAEMARAAAQATAGVLRSAVAERGTARVAIATGNSQLDLIAALRVRSEIPWDAVTVFHLDEYVGMAADHPASFRRWISTRVEHPFGPAKVHYIQGDAGDPQTECERYEELLRAEPLDLVCMGIGENGHIAFNEPNRTDFDDRSWVRVIELDDTSRAQQVGEGHFPSLAATATHAITLTVPALLSARAVQVVVPERRKAAAVRTTLTADVSPACPATLLRHQAHATLYLDRDSAALVEAQP